MKFVNVQFWTIPAIITLILTLAFSGCISTQTPSATGTPSTIGMGTTPPGSNLMPGQTDAVPDYQFVTVDVGEKDYLGNIPVIFEGGKGQIAVKKIDVRLTRSDGQVKTASIGTNKGDSIELEGTKQTDRVEVYVTVNTGQTYKIVDVLRPYRTRG